RDFEFASKYTIEIKPVIYPAEGTLDISEGAYNDYGVLKNSGEFDGQTSEQAITSIIEWLEAKQLGSKKVNYRLRDWGVSRQRYWGCPIPMLYDAQGAETPAAEFPVLLPTDVVMDGVGSPLKAMPEFIDTTNPQTGEPATRETDTFDTFFESSWYYARYCCPDLDSAMLDERAEYWLPVDQYIGGIEHAVMHLLYARFFHKLMRDVGLIGSDEPFKRLLTQGMVTAETFYRDEVGGKREYYNASEVDLITDDKGSVTGATLTLDGKAVEIGPIEKMSKSKNNGVDPQQMIDKYGADTVRLFTMFAAPPDQSLEWNDDAIAGAARFLRRVWNLFIAHRDELAISGLAAVEVDCESDAAKKIRMLIHQLTARVLRDYERQQFNTVVAAAMELTNAAEKADWQAMGNDVSVVRAELFRTLVLMLTPITPHLCEHIVRELTPTESVLTLGWLTVDESALKSDSVDYVVQVNGKLRGKITVEAAAPQSEIELAATQDDNVLRFLDGLNIVKVIVVPNKLVNIVAK
ncbi:MAG: class I tRNA ligase family protein, partial [Pseudomonadota bacterium]